ncbi:hypothetical protein ACFPES_02835 [Paenibacillus sp. GCM10023248]|uniref:hypothetical protein n=1 Tax=Bacillales TaxID=1385 RepID=UPI002377E540|nr:MULTISPECIES: hypothetical protein [Bacillales]MDD9265961.1 hypothetical protein [Paenibacillus sp. MAHUQ-63]MDR6879200.1 hypothetical protein [Bacillus sp. 3255]
MKRPLKVFSASVSLVLVSQLLLLPAHAADTPNAASAKLVEWSTDEVKAYFDPAVDWNLPVQPAASPTPTPAASGSGSGSTAPVVINHVGSGFGWDDLLLYHLIFNSPSPYSSSSWGSSHKSYYYRSNTPYVTKTYQASSFSNKSATKAPTTSSGTGSFTTNKSSSGTKSSTGSTGSVSSSGSSSSSTSGSKSTSASTGSIGGKSSGFSSSSSSGG